MSQPTGAGTDLAPLLLTSPRFADHVTPQGHPERPARAEVMAAVASRWVSGGGAVREPRAASSEELSRIHAADYIDRIAATAGQHARLDPDTYTSASSHAVARLAAGAAIEAVDHALSGAGSAAAYVRPPGHHAETDRAMGFCLFNNVAVGAAHALGRGCERVAIVDYDVHHGNGTQWSFYDNPRVLYISLHRYPFYPGTGASTEVGRAKGAGSTVNVPLEAGSTDADYDLVFREAVVPILSAYGPDLLLVSAGYDAHVRDPLGGMKVSTAGYAAMTRRLRQVSSQHGPGGMVVVTEGGYDLDALEACLDSTLEILRAPAPSTIEDTAGAAPRGEAALRLVRRAQAAYWPNLGQL